MFRKNSIFAKVFVPAIAVLLFQTGIISIALFANGTIQALRDGAIDTLSNNIENRAISLERMMVSYWSNLDKLELDMADRFGAYLAANGITLEEALGDGEHVISMLDAISDPLISTLRASLTTGVFACFVDPGGLSDGPQSRMGIYYRDLDPFANQGDNSDLMFERGHIDIARKDRIQLGSLWQESFDFSPERQDAWRGFANPQLAAAAHPGAAPSDLAYWNRPHLLNQDSPLDSDECVTYSRPFFYDGRLIAVIGSEVQTAELLRFFPASDFGGFAQSGYILMRYSASEREAQEKLGEPFNAEAMQVSGSFIRQLFQQGDELPITGIDDGGGAYGLASRDTQDVRLVFHDMRIYNQNAPFSDERWTLAAVGTEGKLFESSRNVAHGILLSSAIATAAGGMLLALAVRRSTDPLASIVRQIEVSDRIGACDAGSDVSSGSDTYEIALLASAINASRARRRQAESQTREERERYLVALASAADTFMEYDIARDEFMLFYFSEGAGERPALSTRTIPRFMDAVRAGGFCHPDDADSTARFFGESWNEPVEIRARPDEFPHIRSDETDGGYYWLLLRASLTRAGDGSAARIIGTAKEITRDKLAERAVIEVRRRDATTGLFNREHGLSLIRDALDAARIDGRRAALSVLRVEGFGKLEAFHGLVFGGIVMGELGRAIEAAMPSGAIVARLSNDAFIALDVEGAAAHPAAKLRGGLRENAARSAKRAAHAVRGLYAGDNAEIALAARMGTALAEWPEETEPRGPAEPAARTGDAEPPEPAARTGDAEPPEPPARRAQGAGSQCLEELALQADAAARFAASSGVDGAAYDELPEAERDRPIDPKAARLPSKPISISLDARKEGVVSLSFELFERASDVHSAAKALMGLLGRLFALDRMTLCTYDASFGANQTQYEWKNGKILPGGPFHRIEHAEFAEFVALLDENGTLRFSAEDAAGYGPAVSRLLCLSHAADGAQGRHEPYGGLCCEMYENGAHTGRMLFFGQERDWTEDRKLILYEIVKIVAAHLSIEKSHSASRAKSEFLSRVSHEIRTPMNAILGMTDIAMNAGSDAARVRDALRKIDFSAKHLLALINDVLDMSRIESGRLEIKATPFSLTGLASGIETLMRTSLERNGVSFSADIRISNETVIGDEHRLRQVLVNLLGNACKFTDPGGRVTLAIDESPDLCNGDAGSESGSGDAGGAGGAGDSDSYDAADYAGDASSPGSPEVPASRAGAIYRRYRFSVKDTGIGISLDEQLIVFNAFEQAGSPDARRRSGTGLGLAISSSIVSAMGGKIELASKPGQGSDFHFTLRLALSRELADEARAISGSAAAEAAFDYGGCFFGKRALLVEDVAINVEIAEYFLDETGIEVVVAGNGKEAVDLFFGSPAGFFDIILMDIQMPVMDGLTATRMIRRDSARPDARTVPIVAMTANAFDEDMRKSVESGMNGHVAKPLESAKLLALLRRLML